MHRVANHRHAAAAFPPPSKNPTSAGGAANLKMLPVRTNTDTGCPAKKGRSTSVHPKMITPPHSSNQACTPTPEERRGTAHMGTIVPQEYARGVQSQTHTHTHRPCCMAHWCTSCSHAHAPHTHKHAHVPYQTKRNNQKLKGLAQTKLRKKSEAAAGQQLLRLKNLSPADPPTQPANPCSGSVPCPS